MAWRRPPTRLSSNASVYAPRGLDRWAPLRRLGRFNLLLLLTVLSTAVLLGYLLSGQPLVLIAAVVLAGVGVDGLLRTNPDATLRNLGDTGLYLSIPVMFTLGAGVFFRYTLSGLWQVPAALVSGVILASVIHAEYRSVEAGAERYVSLRLILNLAAYLAAFALYTALYNQRLPLPAASVLVGLVSLLIGVDILREAEIAVRVLFIYAATLGFVMVEARWALNFLSLTGWLGGVFILVVFYVASQVMQSYLLRRLDRRVALEFAVVATVGAALVVVGHILSQG